MQIFSDADIDLGLIRARKVAILGYGNQGRAQALNLRDSGVAVRVATGQASARRAVADGFDVMTPAAASAWADAIVMLVPDEAQPALYETVEPHLRAGAALIFAHGLAIRFELIRPRPDIDVLLVAPKGPGTALRGRFEDGGGMVGLVAVHQDASGGGLPLALAYAGALGCGRAGILPTSFAEECEADLFNEAAVIWGAVPELILAGWETLVEAGISPEIAYLECVEELKLLADLIVDRGIAGMREAISNTAEYGAMTGGRRIVTDATRRRMRAVLAEVRGGTLTRGLLAERAQAYPRLRASRRAAAAHPLEAVAARLRGLRA